MMFLKDTDKVWRPTPFPSPELFLSFGDVAAYEADRHEGATPLTIMTLFTRCILKGAFDAAPLERMPFVERMVIDQSLRHMQLLKISAPIDRGLGLPASPPGFHGYGCGNGEDVLLQLALVHKWFEGGPERTTSNELERFKDELCSMEFEELPDVIQGYLNDTLISKEQLEHWYDMRGMSTPWPDASNDNTETSDQTGAALKDFDGEMIASRPQLGRPPKSAWIFIKRRSRELKRENLNQLNKVIAAEVLDEAANDFKQADLPAESTVIKEMGRILKGL